jgi:hypothetical protein
MGKIHKALEKSKKEKKQQQKKIFKSFKDKIESRERNIDIPVRKDDQLNFQPTLKNQRGVKQRAAKKQNKEHNGLEFQPTPGSKLGLIHPLLEDTGDRETVNRKKNKSLKKLKTSKRANSDKGDLINQISGE